MVPSGIDQFIEPEEVRPWRFMAAWVNGFRFGNGWVFSQYAAETSSLYTAPSLSSHAGKRMVNFEPAPTSLITLMVPPWSSIIW